MERYNDLEEQLQVALKSAQQQQKQLVSRESEVQFFPCTVFPDIDAAAFINFEPC